jgi:hypothetical protein
LINYSTPCYAHAHAPEIKQHAEARAWALGSRASFGQRPAQAIAAATDFLAEPVGGCARR